MDKLNSEQDIPTIEAKIAFELGGLLSENVTELNLYLKPNADFLYLLELYIPRLLSHKYLQWEHESLDGFYLANARKLSSNSAEFSGLCILISDQTVTPFVIRLELNLLRNSIASYQVFLGEPGSGSLGISGPSCSSAKADDLLKALAERMDNISWSYFITKAKNRCFL